MRYLFVPKEMNQAILSEIRAALLSMGSVTKAELTESLGISFPTITKFLSQMSMR